MSSAICHTKTPEWMDPLLAFFPPPASVSGDRYIRCVTLHLLWPLCGRKGNSALRDLFLILGGSACVASGHVGSEGMEDAGVHIQKSGAL